MRTGLLRSGREAHVESHVSGRPGQGCTALRVERVRIAGCAGAAVVNVDLNFAALQTSRIFRSFNSPLKSVIQNLSRELRHPTPPPEEGS